MPQGSYLNLATHSTLTWLYVSCVAGSFSRTLSSSYVPNLSLFRLSYSTHKTASNAGWNFCCDRFVSSSVLYVSNWLIWYYFFCFFFLVQLSNDNFGPPCWASILDKCAVWLEVKAVLLVNPCTPPNVFIYHTGLAIAVSERRFTTLRRLFDTKRNSWYSNWYSLEMVNIEDRGREMTSKKMDKLVIAGSNKRLHTVHK